MCIRDSSKVTGDELSTQSSSTNPATVYHLDSGAIYRPGWDTRHISADNDGFVQVVSVFAIGFNIHFFAGAGGDNSITNSNSNFGQISLVSDGFKKAAFDKDDSAYITSIIPPKSVSHITDRQNIDWFPLDVGITTSVGISSHLYLYGWTDKDSKIEWTDGEKYIGKFKDGLKNGKGKYTRPDGSYYEGNFENGL